MSTNNPFEKLNIKRDPDDEENGEFEKVKAKSNAEDMLGELL